MKDYIMGLFRRAYEIIDPKYALAERMKKFEKLKKDGGLELMTASQFHDLFKIKKISCEI